MRRDAHALSKAQTFDAIERVRAAIVAAADRLASNACNTVAVQALEIGCTGTRNQGKDSMLVFVEAENRSRAWGLVIQSKQSFAAKQGCETVGGILQAMYLDLKETHSLPPLKTRSGWHGRGKAAAGTLPGCSPSDAAWDEGAWDQRVIYAYVSCDKLFTEQQEDIRRELTRRGHPWMRRLLIVSHNEQSCWHSRTGALLRYIRAAALKSKIVRDTLRYVSSPRQLTV